jgi:DNA (cytosine-5)-methyltransferase 1
MFQWMLRRFMQCGFGVGYRILNSRFFGIPQHRRRVFAVGCFGSPTSAGKILFDSSPLSVSIAEEQAEEQTDIPTAALGDCRDRKQSRMEGHTVFHIERYGQNNPVVGTLTTQVDAGIEQISRIVIDDDRPRYLLPAECEKLQGFEAGYTEGFSDTQRYKMVGNSMPVPIIRWIGQRILQQERATAGRLKAAG